MIKKTISWTDFNDQTVTEDFYFHLSKPEVLQLEVGVDGGMSELIKKITAANNSKELVEWFKKIVLMSYGEKSLDGRRFMKNEQLAEAFSQTGAFSELFMELATNDQAAVQFIKGVLPPTEEQDKPKVQVTNVGLDKVAPPLGGEEMQKFRDTFPSSY